MVEVFTDKALSLDNLLSYGPMHSAFEEFMKQEKSMGKTICIRIVDSHHGRFYQADRVTEMIFRCSFILFDEL